MEISAVFLSNQNFKTRNIHISPLFRGTPENMEVLLNRIGFSQNDAALVAADIIKTYSKQERGYHGIRHISNMLKSFNRYLLEASESGVIKNPDEFRFAILMHDYVNGEADDVEKSVLKAKEFLYSITPLYDTSYVEKLILATDYSKKQSLDFEQELMQDIDIEILGKSPDEYKKYSENIRRQYVNIPNEKFNPARIEILESFIGRKNIYNTKYYRDRYENQARINIEQEIQILKSAD